MGKIFEKIRRALIILVNVLKRPWVLAFSLEDFRFLSDRETLLYLKEKGVGIVRFGDADLRHLAGGSMWNQKYSVELRRRLAEVLSGYTKDATFLVALPLDLFFGGEKAYRRRGASPKRWRALNYAALPFLKRNHVYGSPFCFKNINMTDADKQEHIAMIRNLFENRDVIYMGNTKHAEDILDIVAPRESIAVPFANAFDSYEDLLKKAVQAAEKFANPVVLLTASSTATILSADLNKRGILAYDIGVPFPKKSKK